MMLESQKQTRKFHPLWIIAVITIMVGSIIWGLAELLAKSDYRAALPEKIAAPGSRPATIEQEAPDTFWIEKNGLKKT
jgi:predicted lysophospholipase L1 biosynthesis ABC-type transport system permease subunit